MGDAVDLARQALGGLEQCLGGGGLEDRRLAAGQHESMGEVAGQLFASKPAQEVAHDDAQRQ